MRRLVSTTALVAVMAGAALVAQQANAPQAPAAQPDQRPTFRTRIDYVEVSATVTDKNGNPVTDLTAADFTVLEDGKPQTISVFQPVTIPFERQSRTLVNGKPLKFDVASNEGVRDGRVYVIVLDDNHIEPLLVPGVKRVVREFVENHMAVNDQVAVIHVSGRNKASQEFTTDKDAVLRAVDQLQGLKLRSATLEKLDDYRSRVQPMNDMTASDTDDAQTAQAKEKARDMLDPERAFKARASMDTLRNLARVLETVNGSRKSVLFFSQGIDYDVTDVMGINGARYASDVLYALRDAIGAATRSNVAFYTIDPRGLTAMSSDEAMMDAPPQDVTLGLNPWNVRDEQRMARMSLMTLAEETGGVSSVDSNGFTKFYERVVRDNSTYYLLGYYPAESKRDGRVHRIQVKVNRPDLRVYARKAYLAPKDKEEKKVEESAAGTSPAVREALNAALPTPGLGISAHAAPFKGVGKNASVMVTVQVDGNRLAFREAGETFNNAVEISMMAMDVNGKIVDGDRANLELKLRKQTRDLMSQTGLRSIATLNLPPGRYQLRVAAREANDGGIGSVFTDLEVPDFNARQLSMSGILLSSTVAGLTPTPRIDEETKKLLPRQAPPATSRGFSQFETLFGFVDVYDGISQPHKVDVVTTVTNLDGARVFSTTETRDSAELGGGRGGYGTRFEIPLQDFAPGLYVLRVEAKPTVKGDPVSRELTFAVYGNAPEGAAAAEPRVVPIAHGPLSNGSSAREMVIRTSEDWAALWSALPTRQATPNVAFDQMMVVGVFIGNRPTSGYKVEITGARLDGDALVVQWREVTPPQGASVTNTVTSPFAVAAVARHDGPVRFEQVQ